MTGQPGTLSETAARILIVDDNEALAMTYAWLLEDAGYCVKTCHNGADGLDCVDGFRPDVLLLDIGMPVMDGLQVCRTLRGNDAWKGLAIIAQSGYGDNDMRVRTAEAGFDRHLVKPIEFDDLLQTLREVLAEKAA
ncbi:MAG: response regulator [Asticcacaulis sp.]|nr:response regulator [Asticcacaulis sp.]